MAYKISEDCISCGACEPECPNQAISEGETVYVIDPDSKKDTLIGAVFSKKPKKEPTEQKSS